MKTLLLTFLLLSSLSAMAKDCSLFIDKMESHSSLNYWKALQETQKMMTNKGYVIVSEFLEARFTLSGEFKMVKYQGLLDLPEHTATLIDHDYPYSMISDAKSFSELTSLRKALKKFPECH